MLASRTALPFDALVFDLDGTLADTATEIRSALGRAFRDIGYDVVARLDVLVDGSPLEEILAVVAPGADARDRRRFVAAYAHHYDAALVAGTRLFPGVRETLEALSTLRPALRLGVATSRRDALGRAIVEAAGLWSVFDCVAGSGGTALRAKPAPDLLFHVAAQLGVSPARTLVVGDTRRDVHAARAAGMRSAAVTYGLGRIDDLVSAEPDHLLEEFDELLALLGVRE